MKVAEGERLRFGYGVAWRNYDSRTFEAFIVPFNHLARWARNTWHWLVKPRKQWADIIYHQGYDQGYENGKNYGHLKSYREGVKDGKEEVYRLLEEEIAKLSPLNKP